MHDERPDDWEALGREIFAPLRSLGDPPAALADKTLSRIHASISARDLIELGTSGLVLGFLAPALDMLAYALGLAEQGDTPHD